MPEIPKITDPRQIARPKGVRIDPRLAGAPGRALAELGRALGAFSEREVERQQRLEDADFITRAVLDYQRGREEDLEHGAPESEAAGANLTRDFLQRSHQALEDNLRNASKGVSEEGAATARRALEDVQERFLLAALERHGEARDQRALETLLEAGLQIADVARRHPRALPTLLESAEGLVDRYTGALLTRPEVKREFLAVQRAGTIISALKGLTEAGDFDAARELLGRNAFGGELGPKQTRRLLSRIAEAEKERAADNAERAATEKARRAFELQVRVSSGAASEEEVDQALANDAIGAEQHARLTEELERQAEERRRRTEGIARIAEILARGEKPDASNPADRQAVDVHFETVSDSLAELPPEDRATAEDLYVQQTGVLPTAIKNALLGGLLSSDPAAQLAAAQRLARLEDTDPAATEGILEAPRARARALVTFALPGLTPERAVELAEEGLEEAVETRVEEAGADTATGTFQQLGTDGSGGQTLVSQVAPQPSAQPVQQLADPWPQSPVSKKFRDEIHRRESQKHNYQEFSPSGPAWGRYQLTPDGLEDAGIMRPDGSWTGKYGVKTAQDFLNSPKAQEQAFSDYMKANQRFLKNNSSTKHLNQQVNGIRAKFKITMSGLLAAAHRRGAAAVKRYLEHQEANDWTSNPKNFPLGPTVFKEIETRLREFENISHKAP